MNFQHIVQLFLLSLVLAITGCGKGSPSLSPLLSDHTILAFGDSLTYGTGAGADETYPAVLERISGRKVINEGIPGELSAKGMSRLPAILDEYQPQLLILCHGGNDILRKKPMEQMADNLSVMIQEARSRNIEVVLIGVPQFSLLVRASEPQYRQVAEKFGIPIETDILPEIISSRELKSDHVHPNAAGYQKMAEAIHQLLIEKGAL